jgi:hypothetical protein
VISTGSISVACKILSGGQDPYHPPIQAKVYAGKTQRHSRGLKLFFEKTGRDGPLVIIQYGSFLRYSTVIGGLGIREIYGKYLSDEAHEQRQLPFQIQQPLF